jgi:hypothetical protein
MKYITYVICLVLLGPAVGQTVNGEGHWVMANYQVSCGGSAMNRETYVMAFIVKSNGDPACSTGRDGNFLKITKTSRKYSAYFGLAGVLNEMLAPGQTITDNVSPYYQLNKPPVHFEQGITLKYWVEK